jgi:paraquat-inducible protein A
MTIACPDCGTLQDVPILPPRAAAVCIVCDTHLERTSVLGLGGALALSLTTLILLFPANFLPLVRVDLMGDIRQSYLISGGVTMWRQGWPMLGSLVALFGVILPFGRFGLMTIVLTLVQLNRRPPWLGRMFRWANLLEVWAMPDVLLIAFWVAYARLKPLIPTSLDGGGYCFIAVGVLTLFARAALDKRAVWRAIGPELSAPVEGATVSCPECDLLLPYGRQSQPCPRCGEKLHPRRRDAVVRALALTIGGLILYFPANIYPMVITLQQGRETGYNILEGIKQIFLANLFGLGLLVTCTSFLIPLLKLFALAWFVASVQRRSTRYLKTKTRLFGVVEEIGRWSMVDPFTISFVGPLLQYGQLTSSFAGAGSLAFTLVVVLTVLATRAFDPRLMWDAAAKSQARIPATQPSETLA